MRVAGLGPAGRRSLLPLCEQFIYLRCDLFRPLGIFDYGVCTPALFGQGQLRLLTHFHVAGAPAALLEALQANILRCIDEDDMRANIMPTGFEQQRRIEYY